MAGYTAIVTASGIQLLGSSGTLTTLPLPSGVIMTGLPAYLARLNNRLIITNSVSSPIWLGSDLSLRLLTIPQPAAAPVLATGASGTYTGTRKCRVSFILRDATGKVIAEGPLSAESNSVTFTAQLMSISNIVVPPSNAPVSDRRIYVTTDNGSTYFHAFDIAGVVATTVSTQVSDAALSLVAADTDLVAAPSDIDLITVWKNRVWGRSQIDTLVGTTAGTIDRWPNAFPIEQGIDSTGITGFLARRDELAIGRRDRIWKMTGDDETTFALVKVVDGKGILAPLSCLVIRDIGYFLSDDGVYSWGPDGISCLTDASVRPWFTEDTYFNRGQFSSAFAGYDPVSHRYRLYLPNVGSTVIDRWIDLDITTGKWFGIHKCAAVTNFTAATFAPDANGVLRAIVAANDGFLYAPTPGVFHDNASTAIDFDVTTKAHFGADVDNSLLWLQPSIFTNIESGGTLVITPAVGDLNATPDSTTLSHDLTIERERLPRIGDVGRQCQLRLRQNTVDQAVQIYGYELPYVDLGRR